MDSLLAKHVNIMIKNKSTPLEDRSKLVFFDFFDKIKNKDQIFDQFFNVVRSLPSSSANGFVSIISLKIDSSLKFILKTPKSTGGDDPEIEYKVAKELTRQTILDKKIPDCVVKTWASVKCIPGYKNKGEKTEGLGDKACSKTENNKPVTHIIMEYIDGGTLHEYIEKSQLKDTMNILGIINGCIHSLRKKTGFTHYDLHTNNIMIQKTSEKREYLFDISNNKFNFSSEYRPVFIDFGRTYINPFISGKQKINLTERVPTLFKYPSKYFTDEYRQIADLLINPFTHELVFEYKIQDILREYSKLKVKKDRCSYNLREKALIVSATIIMEYLNGDYSIKNITGSDENKFIKFIFKNYLTHGKNIVMDIIPIRENNVCDMLKITSSVLDYFNDIDTELVHREILVNFPFLLPFQNFLPMSVVNKINNKRKISGIFCLNNASDILKLMIDYSLLPKSVLIKSSKNTGVSRNEVLKVELPGQKNIKTAGKIVDSIILSEYNKSPPNSPASSIIYSTKAATRGIKRQRNMSNIFIKSESKNVKKQTPASDKRLRRMSSAGAALSEQQYRKKLAGSAKSPGKAQSLAVLLGKLDIK